MRSMAKWAVLIGLALAGPASAQDDGAAQTAPSAQATSADGWPDLIPTEAFATRNDLRDAKLSPDGRRIAVETVVDGRATIAVFDTDSRALVTRIDTGRAGWLRSFRWAGNQRLLYSIGGNAYAKSKRYRMTGQWATSTMVHDIVTGFSGYVGLAEQGFRGDDILHVDPAGDHVLMSIAAKWKGDPDVWRFSLSGGGIGAAQLVQKRRNGINSWQADTGGVVRLGLRSVDRSDYTFFYRGSAGEDWQRVGKVDKDDRAGADMWDAIGIRPGSDEGYAIMRNAGGRKVLRAFDFRTGTPGKVVFAHPLRDVHHVDLDRDGTLLAAAYVEDTTLHTWLDPELAELQTSLETALGSGQVMLQPAYDGPRLLVEHSDAADPGALYIYTRATKRLDLFDDFKRGVDFAQLAPVRRIAFDARDGTPIEGYLTLPRQPVKKPAPLVIMPHGGPYGVRDTAKYDDDVQLLANRGYAVLQPNYRGSGGLGAAFEDLGIGEVGRRMQDDLDDAMDWAVAQGHADPDRVCMVGGSYGGYASLWAVIRNPERYRCAASWAGVTDWPEQLEYDRDFFERHIVRRWQGQVAGEDKAAALAAYSPARQVSRLTWPVLLAHGTADWRVPFSQFESLRDAAKAAGKPVEELVLAGEGHGFSDAVNTRKWYDALLAFLAKHNPSDRPMPVAEDTGEDDADNAVGGIRRVETM